MSRIHQFKFVQLKDRLLRYCFCGKVFSWNFSFKHLLYTSLRNMRLLLHVILWTVLQYNFSPDLV